MPAHFSVPESLPQYHDDLLLVRTRAVPGGARPALSRRRTIALVTESTEPAGPSVPSALAHYLQSGVIRRIVDLDGGGTEAAGPRRASSLRHEATGRATSSVRSGASILELQPGTNLPQMQLALSLDAAVESVSRVPVRYLAAKKKASRPAAAPPSPTELWNLRKINWSRRMAGDSDVHVAVLDTGIDVGHPDLPADVRLVNEYADVGSSERDIVGHGTHVAETIRALVNGATGINGICGCRLSAYKIFGDTAEFDGESEFGYFVDPIMYRSALAACLDDGVQVINLSIGGFGEPDEQERVLFEELIAAGVCVVAAMGNEETRRPSYPAAIPGVIAVGATDLGDRAAAFSNRGNHIALCAPGVGIWSTLPRQAGQTGFRARFDSQGRPRRGSPFARETDYDSWDGTSMASPHVAAAAALAIEKHGDLSPADLRELLMGAVDKVPSMNGRDFTIRHGSGRLNLARI